MQWVEVETGTMQGMLHDRRRCRRGLSQNRKI